eukprot:SAG22_NODE_1770_length_3614_cov_1.183784_2_plen_204_part_00
MSPFFQPHEWFGLNCIFVLGEVGTAAPSAAAGQLLGLVRTAVSHRVVRMCLASAGQILGAVAASTSVAAAVAGGDGSTSGSVDPAAAAAAACLAAAAEAVAETITGPPRAAEWLALESQSGLFCPLDQVKVLAAELAFALGSHCTGPAVIDALIAALSGTCGYVSEIAAKALHGSGERRGLDAAARYWQAVAWDGALRIGANY